MSEYQYYEFLALDRALSKSELSEVRSISSRAELTPNSFVNEYEWGDFKGDPFEFLEKYYDVMLYFANWGTRRFMVNVPAELDAKLVRAYCTDGESGLAMKAGKRGITIDFVSQTEEPEDWEEMEEARLAPLLPIREELAGGDLRGLYLGWLCGVASGERGEEETEPPVPPGLSKLSTAQEALARFLRIDEELLDAAAKASGRANDQWTGLEDWIAKLPEAKKNKIIFELCTGEGGPASAKLRREFGKNKKGQNAPAEGTRTVGDLLRESGR